MEASFLESFLSSVGDIVATTPSSLEMLLMVRTGPDGTLLVGLLSLLLTVFTMPSSLLGMALAEFDALSE